tara:strand:- start:2063 stop:3232 length:1170 start_codon:yes stop_codon:yes gene_type:complete
MNKKLNTKGIAVITNSLLGGGTEKMVIELCYYLVLEKKRSVTLVLLENKKDFNIKALDNLKIIYLTKTKRINGLIRNFLIPYYSLKYYYLIRKNNCEVSLSFLPTPNYINIIGNRFFRSNVKTVINERSYPSTEYKSKSFRSLINKFLIKNLYNYSDLLISNSIGNANDLKVNFKITKPIEIIYNPVWKTSTKNLKTRSTSKEFNKEKINFVTIGRLDKNKNHIALINIIEQLGSSKVNLYILGKGDQESELIKAITDKKLQEQIFLLGFKSNPEEYLRKADAFLFSSKSEGFPNVLLESLANNLPIISYNCKSGPDEIFFNEPLEINTCKISKIGILVPMSNQNEFVNAIKYFIANKDKFNDVLDFDLILKKYTQKNTLEKFYNRITN